MQGLLPTLVIGLLCGLLLLRLKVPAGMLVGAIVGAAVLNIATQGVPVPACAKDIAQVTTGAYIGCTVSRDDIAHFPKIAGPFFIMMSAFLALNLLVGFFICSVSPLDLMTSLLCAMPGGISDTPLIAIDLGADAPKVAIMQMVRLLFGMIALPAMIILFDRVAEKRAPAPGNPALVQRACELSPDAPAVCGEARPKPSGAKPLLLTLAIAAAGGMVGRWLHIPAGVLLFSTIAVTLANMLFHNTRLPMWCRRLAQVLSGCVIGSSITLSDLMEMRGLVLPIAVLVAGYILNTIVTGYLLYRLFPMSRREGMLYTSPAGASEMALIAADLGVESADVMVAQILRLLAVMTLFPQLFVLLVRLFP